MYDPTKLSFDISVHPIAITINATGQTRHGWQTTVMPDHRDWAEMMYRGRDYVMAVKAAHAAIDVMRREGCDFTVAFGKANSNRRPAPAGVA